MVIISCMIGFEFVVTSKGFCTDGLLYKLSVQNSLYLQNRLFVHCKNSLFCKNNDPVGRLRILLCFAGLNLVVVTFV